MPKPKIKLGGSLFNAPRPAVNPGAPSSVPHPSGLSQHPARASVDASAAAHQGFGVGSGLASAALGGGHGELVQRQKDKKHKRERHADETPEDRAERKRAKKERKGEKKVCI